MEGYKITVMENFYRHGDLMCRSNATIPKGAKASATSTLAEGEVTGHHHTFVSGTVQVYDAPAVTSEGIVKYFEVKSKEAVLDHQEHGKMTLPQGTYALSIEREYSPVDKVIRQVLD